MRYMSFALTKQQFLNRTKTVTRRVGWAHAKPGDILMGCEKVMGFRKGEKITTLGPIRVIESHCEPLNAITQEEVDREGFPELTPDKFIDMFCLTHTKCMPETVITRIAFEYIDVNEDQVEDV